MAKWLQQLGEASAARTHTIWTLLTLIGFLSGLVLGYTIRQPEADKATDDSVPLALCTRVLDGDTVEVEWMGNTEHVRILGIDAPETRRTSSLRSQAERLEMDPEFLLQYGDVAKKTVEMWLLDRRVRLVFPDDEVLRDSFGRLLAYVELQETDIGERLLLGGNAIVYEAEHPREEAYLLFQAEAQKQQRGIWRNQ